MLKNILAFLFMRPVFQFILKCFFSLEIRGAEHLKQLNQNPVILVGNHTGFLDGPIVMSALNRPLSFLVAQEVLSWPVVGVLIRLIDIIPVVKEKPRKALKRTLEYIKRRKALCIFPEGKLTHNGELGEFSPGVAFVHNYSRSPIIPFAIYGGYEAWPWGQRFPTFRKIYIQFGEPIYHVAGKQDGLMEKIKASILKMKDNLMQEELSKTIIKAAA